MRQDYYVYAYLREDGSPYYIGKGCKGRAYSRHNRNNNATIPKDKSRIVFLEKNLSEPDALFCERHMIALLGRKDTGTGILRNLTDGGEGITGTTRKLSEAHKEKIRQKAIGRKWTKEMREKMETLRGDDGRFHSPTTTIKGTEA